MYVSGDINAILVHDKDVFDIKARFRGSEYQRGTPESFESAHLTRGSLDINSFGINSWRFALPKYQSFGKGSLLGKRDKILLHHGIHISRFESKVHALSFVQILKAKFEQPCTIFFISHFRPYNHISIL